MKPGVSVAGVALAHGINANLVRRWIVRQQRELVDHSAKPQAVMLPVTINAQRAPVVIAADAQIDTATKQRRSGATTIEIDLAKRIDMPNGWF